jgi:isopentenyl-diphosphate delta-isomerase
VDYILFVQRDKITVEPNPNEVRDFKFVTMEELENMIQEASQGKLQVTPWFKLIYDNLLSHWWQQLKMHAVVTQDSVIHHL